MADDHAPFAPSAMKRLMACPGSYAMVQRAPQMPAGEWATEGTLAHDFITKILTKKAKLESVPEKEMRDYIFEYIRFLRSLEKAFEKNKKSIKTWSEQKVTFTDECWGTLDYSIIGQNQDKSWDLVIVDFKYGKGVEVDVEDNEQLLTYAVCVATSLKIAIRNAYLYIYQPRIPDRELPYERVQVSGKEIDKFAKRIDETIKRAKHVAKRKIIPDDYLAGGEHCRFCSGKTICPSFKAHIHDSALPILNNAPDLPAVQDIPIPEMVSLFSKRKLIKKLLDDIEIQLNSLAESGVKLPGYQLIHKKGNRKWIDDTEKVARGLAKLGVSNPYKESLIGIGEAEKAIGKGKIDHLTENREGTTQLVPESDKRITEQSAGSDLLTDLT